MMVVAIIGATFSPYLFFWQTSKVAEEDLAQNKITEISKIQNKIKNKKNNNGTINSKIKNNDDMNIPKVSKKEIRSMRIDITIGMTFVQIIGWSIMITTVGSLHINGITHIQTADPSAKALEPVVKSFPFFRFNIKNNICYWYNQYRFFVYSCFSRFMWFVLADVFGGNKV